MGYRLTPENFRSWLRYIWCFCLEKLIKYCVNIIPKQIQIRLCVRFVVLKRSYSANTQPIWKQRYPRGAKVTYVCLLLFEFNNFSFLIGIIDNIMYASGTCHQNSNQWQCSIIVTCLRLYHETSILPIGESSGHVIRTFILHIYILV